MTTQGGRWSLSHGLRDGWRGPGPPHCIGPLRRAAPSKQGWHPPSALRCHPEDAGMLLGLLSRRHSRTIVGCSPCRRGMLGGGIQRCPGMDGAGVHRNASKPVLNNAAPEEGSPPDTPPAKLYRQIYGEISSLLWVVFGVFLLKIRISLNHRAASR